jgi:hypothetical protein
VKEITKKCDICMYISTNRITKPQTKTLIFMIKKNLLLAGLLITMLYSVILTGCKENKDDDDDDPIAGAVPSLVLTAAQASGTPGSSVNTSVTINAPEGIKKLTIFKNGTPLQDINYNYEKTATYSFTYPIESNLTAGTTINIAFEAVDSLDRKSDQKTFTITVDVTPAKEIIQVSGDITTTTTFTANKIWRINNIVKVTDGVTLTIEPGTIVFGASDTQGTLVVMRGGKLIADGTSNAPIVFTSDKAAGTRSAGDWGGIIICGKAPNNQGTSVNLEGMTGISYGGNVSADNSGTLRYVRIEFAGKVIQDNKEINSLTLASVGSGTIIENVQCSFGLDDSFEFFGGTVNAKRIVSYRTRDDDIDIDNGHVGFIQFALCLRDASTGDIFLSNGLEIDNDGGGTNSAPYTQPVLSNISVIGGKYTADNTVSAYLQNAAHIRRNSMPTLYNSLFTGFPAGIFIDDTKPGASQHALDGNLQIRNVILAGVENWGNNNWGGSTNNTNAHIKQAGTVAPGFVATTWFSTVLFNNSKLDKWQETGIDQSLYTSNTPIVTPAPGSMILTAAKWDNALKASGSFFEKVAFAGAFGTENWSQDWCNWDPQNAVYQ